MWFQKGHTFASQNSQDFDCQNIALNLQNGSNFRPFFSDNYAHIKTTQNLRIVFIENNKQMFLVFTFSEKIVKIQKYFKTKMCVFK